MIRFGCPTCKKTLQAPAQQAGQKVACPGCGQRLQIPTPPRNKTVLGSLLPEDNPAAGPEPAPALTGASPVNPAAPAGTAWYYTRGREKNGPVSWADLQKLAVTGDLNRKALVWTTGMPRWTPAAAVNGLALTSPGLRAPGRRRGKILAWGGLGLVLAAGVAVAVFFGVLGNRNAPAAQGSELVRQQPRLMNEVKQDQPKKPEEPRKEEQKKAEPKKEPAKKAEQAQREPGKPAPRAEEKPRELKPWEIVARSEKSVALIRHPMGFGTGFVVRPGIVATNAHVINGALVERLRVYFPGNGEAGKRPVKVEAVLFVDYHRDLALLKVASDVPPLAVAPNYEFRRGQDVTVIGNPGLGDGEVALENAVSQGVMSTKANLDGQDYYQLSIAVNPGNSGGPVFDSTGRVIGVVVAKAVKQEGVAFCIPVSYLNAAIARAENEGREEVVRTTARHNANAVASGLLDLGKSYAVGLEKSAEVVQDALKAGRDPGPAVVSFRQNNAKLIGKLAGILGDLEATLNRLAADPNMSPELVKNLKELHAKVVEMKNLIEGKDLNKYTPRAYCAKVQSLIGEYLELRKKL